MRALTPREAQRTFRACLDALAQPGTLVAHDRSALPSGVPAAYSPMLALTDLMTPIAALDDDPLIAELAIVTGAPIVPLHEARWVASATRPTASTLAALSGGSTWSPEHGAVLCQQLGAVHDGTATREAELMLDLDGPGVDGQRRLAVTGIDESFIAARAALVDYPIGIDVLLVTDDTIVGLPRTTHVRSTRTEDAR